MRVRPALPGDARRVAEIHVESWRVAYQGLVPDAVLAALSVDQREAMWTRSIAERSPRLLVAEDDAEVILGFVSAGESRDADATPTVGEVWAIYVDPPAWRRGAGRALWDEAVRFLANAGAHEVTLWVLRDNVRGRAFYATVGLVPDGAERVAERGGARMVEIRLRGRLTIDG